MSHTGRFLFVNVTRWLKKYLYMMIFMGAAIYFNWSCDFRSTPITHTYCCSHQTRKYVESVSQIHRKQIVNGVMIYLYQNQHTTHLYE